MTKTINYQEYLIESLQNPKEAAGYLSAALEEGDTDSFLIALKNVIKAHGGITKLAKKSHKSRTSLYKALSEDGNPYLKNTKEILSAVGMQFSVVANTDKLRVNTR